MTKITRRQALGQAAGAGAVVGAATLLGAPAVLRAAPRFTIKHATLMGGWGQLSNEVFYEKNFAGKYDFTLAAGQTYNSLATYYADFAKGNVDIGIGGWDFFAKIYMRGAPVRIIGIISTGSMAGFLGAPNGPRSLSDLRGKTVAAMQVSSTYKMTKVWLEEFGGIAMEKDILVQNAPNPPATIALLAGQRVDASLTWEHSLSLGLHKIKGSDVFLNVGTYYKEHTKRNMPYFCVAVNENVIKKLPKDAVSRIAAAYSDNLNWIMHHRDDYAARAKKLKIDPAVIKTAMDSGRLNLQMHSMSEETNRADVLYAANILQKAKFFPKKLDEGVFSA